MKTKIAVVLVGVALMLLSLWLGTYWLNHGPEWAKFPTVMTGALGMTGGLFVVGYGLIELK